MSKPSFIGTAKKTTEKWRTCGGGDYDLCRREDYIARMKKKCEKLGCFLECSFEFLLGF